MWFFYQDLNSSNFGKYDTLSSETCKDEYSTLNGVCASFRGKAKIQNKITRSTVRDTEFWASLSIYRQQM
jgi:hypothetical protein